MKQENDIIDDYDLFVNTFIGDRWHKIPATKKMIILKKFNEIQEAVKNNTFSY
jgi:hypothetical protein